MTEGDPRQSVEFKPAVLGRRRRRVDPTLVGVIAVSIGLAAAVVKPWDLATPADGLTELRAGPSLDAGPSPRPVPTGPLVPRVDQEPLAWSDIASIAHRHDAWGVRAIVKHPGLTPAGTWASYDEHWSPVSSTGVSRPRATLHTWDQAIVALGLTFPDGRTPLDVRIWRRSTSGALNWLDARPIGRAPAQGGLIFAPPTTDPASPSWGAGEYRIDALTSAGTIHRFDVDIPDRYENVRPSSIDPPTATELVPSFQVDPTGVPVGPFATIDLIGLPLDSVGGVPLDEAGAWLDTEAGSGRVPADRVAVAYLPRATGLGVRLPDGATVRAAEITRLAPGPLIGGPKPIGGGIIDRRHAEPWVVFAARRGDAWAPGIYRIDVTWSDESGLQAAAWHIELRPGPYAGPPPLLAMARAWARHAGRSGIVLGRAGPLEGGPRSSAIRPLRAGASDPPGDLAGSATRCRGTIVDGSPEAIGLAYPPDDPLSVTRVRMDGPEPPARNPPMLLASDVVPGLSLIAPTDGASFRPGIYRLGVESAAGSRVLTLCVGGATANE